MKAIARNPPQAPMTSGEASDLSARLSSEIKHRIRERGENKARGKDFATEQAMEPFLEQMEVRMTILAARQEMLESFVPAHSIEELKIRIRHMARWLRLLKETDMTQNLLDELQILENQIQKAK